MQDRYAGDIGDYGKMALLRVLQSYGLSIAVNWYMVESLDIEKEVDGTYKHKDGKYLISEKLKFCDPILAETLTAVAQSDERSVRALEQAGLIKDAVYYNEPVTMNGRTEWHNRAIKVLKSANLVFADPDNGLLVKSVSKKSIRSVKYIYYEEVRDYIRQEQSVLIYNHRSRKNEAQYFHEICSKLQEVTGVLETDILKITFPKCSVRDYFAVPASAEHMEKMKSAFAAMEQGIWGKTGMCRIPR